MDTMLRKEMAVDDLQITKNNYPGIVIYNS